MADLSVQNHGTIFLLVPETEAGKQWLADNVASEPWQWFGPGLAVEPRQAWDLVSGAQADGLEVI